MMFLPKHKGIIYDERIVEEVKSIDRIILDEYPADNGSEWTQDEWIEYWNDVTDGRVMASMGDLYLTFKQLKIDVEQGRDKEKVENLLASLRNDFDWLTKNSWLTTSTRLFNEGNNLNARIIQHYGCKNSELIKESNIEIPIYRGTPITKVVSNPKGLVYLQTFFDTTDDGETIIQTLKFISQKNRKNIKIWTENESDRSSVSSWEVSVGYYNSKFQVYGDYHYQTSGRSRGVRIK